mgnify:CR=1 FL=1
MKRNLLLVTAFVALSCSTRPASAQFGGMNFNTTPMGETIQQQRQELLSQHQKYSQPISRAAPPAPRFQPGGRVDEYGRRDLSGRPAPGYPVIRDGSLSFSRSHATYTRVRRTPIARPQPSSLYPSMVTSRRFR